MRTRWQGFKLAMEALGKIVLFFWHETFGHHDPWCTKVRFLHGRRLISMECGCGAEWYDIDVTDGLPE